MLLVGISVFIMMTGSFRDHRHNAGILKKQREEPQVVVLNKMSDDVTEVIQSMLQSALKSGALQSAQTVTSGRSDDSAAPLLGSRRDQRK
jgi:hypothetical protein